MYTNILWINVVHNKNGATIRFARRKITGFSGHAWTLALNGINLKSDFKQCWWFLPLTIGTFSDYIEGGKTYQNICIILKFYYIKF